MITPGDLTSKQLKMIPRDQRKQSGKSGETYDEAQARATHKSEREMQSMIRQWLDLQGWSFSWQRMDKRTRGKLGTPDFVICVPGSTGPGNSWRVGLFVAIECKMPGQQLKPDQEKERMKIVAAYGRYLVATSAKEAIDWLIEVSK